MVNSQRRAILTALKLADLAVVTGAFLLAVCLTLRDKADWHSVLEIRVEVQNIAFVLAYLAYWHIVLHGRRLYRSYRLSTSSREWQDLAVAVLIGVAPVTLLVRPLGLTYATAEFFAAFAGLAIVGLGMERRLLRALARAMRRHGRNLRSAIIVGNGAAAFDMASRLARKADLGYQIVAVIDASTPSPGSRIETERAGNGHDIAPANTATDDAGDAAGRAAILGRLASAIDQQSIDEVFVTLPLDSAQPLIRAIILVCEEQGITVRLLSTLIEPLLARAQLDEVDNRPVITIYTGPPDSLQLLAKRLLDVSASLVTLLLLAPVFVLLAIAIKLDSRGPAFFGQERVGLNRRRFWTYKFRTMVANAEQQQSSLEFCNEAEGPLFKIRNDPRVTRVGSWLRRSSLDELPQFFNVLRGEMSLVGPRPLPLRDVSLFDSAAHKRRFSVKPGITCLWQVNGREPLFEDWIKADMEYIDRWSLTLDLKILLKTIPAVFSGRGAY